MHDAPIPPRSILPGRRARPARYVRLAALALLAGAIAPIHAEDRVYTFTDERGVVNLSNVPADARYRETGVAETDTGRGHASGPTPAAATPSPTTRPGPASGDGAPVSGGAVAVEEVTLEVESNAQPGVAQPEDPAQAGRRKRARNARAARSAVMTSEDAEAPPGDQPAPLLPPPR